MRDHQDAQAGVLLGAVHALGHDAQRVHVEARVGLVQHGELGLEQFQLQHLGALLLAAGEALVHGTGGELRVHLEPLHGLGQFLGPGADGRGLAVYLGFGGAQEIGHRHARHLHRVLHGQEQAGLGALVRRHRQQVLAVQQHLAGFHLVLGVAGQRVGQRGLAGAVRAHDGVGLPRVDGQVHAFEDLLAAVLGFDRGVQVLDFQRRHLTSPPKRLSWLRFRRGRACGR